jgi:hypothetical protein
MMRGAAHETRLECLAAIRERANGAPRARDALLPGTKPGAEKRRFATSRLGNLAPHTYLCRRSHMATNLAIDDALIEEARRVGGQKTKKATVTEALNEYIQRRRQKRVVGLFGKIDLDPKYEYKAQRHRR